MTVIYRPFILILFLIVFIINIQGQPPCLDGYQSWQGRCYLVTKTTDTGATDSFSNFDYSPIFLVAPLNISTISVINHQTTTTTLTSMTDCFDWRFINGATSNGIYRINPGYGLEPFDVYC